MAIINPLWFYFIDFLTNLKSLCSAFFGWFILFAIIGYICYGIFSVIICDCKEGSVDYNQMSVIHKASHKIGKICLIACIVTGIFNLAIPSQDTMYTMLVANFVTYENVEIATESIKDGVDYIFEKLNEEQEKEE